jgi:hypothetical protein
MCNETNLTHCLSSVYSVTTPLHVLGLLVAHHQEVTVYICDSWYVLYVLVDCWRANSFSFVFLVNSYFLLQKQKALPLFAVSLAVCVDFCKFAVNEVTEWY